MGAYEELNERQRRVVDHYLVSDNKAAAYRDAGYADHRPNAHRLITSENVQRAITERRQAIQQEADFTLLRWLQGIVELAEQGDSEAARVSAYSLLAKYLGINDAVDHRHLVQQLPPLDDETIRRLAAPHLPAWPQIPDAQQPGLDTPGG